MSNPFDFLGLSDVFGWTIIGILILIPSLQLIAMYKHKYSKKCRNCGLYAGKQILCEKCYNQYKDLFPHEWKNKK